MEEGSDYKGHKGGNFWDNGNIRYLDCGDGFVGVCQN